MTRVVGLVGAGNIASAMVEGWVGADASLAASLVVTDRGSGRAGALAERFGLLADRLEIADVVARADVVVLCVKPNDVERVLRVASPLLTADKTVCSVAAGVTTTDMEALLDHDVPVFRLMPNVPVRVGRGTIAYAPGRFSDPATEQAVRDLFGLIGAVVPVEERLFDVATAISGSGPAFLSLIIEALEDAAAVAGLSYAAARELILPTVAGTAALLAERDLACATLRRSVTSPGGTSAAGLAQLERAGARAAIIDCVLAATTRAGELG